MLIDLCKYKSKHYINLKQNTTLNHATPWPGYVCTKLKKLQGNDRYFCKMCANFQEKSRSGQLTVFLLTNNF